MPRFVDKWESQRPNPPTIIGLATAASHRLRQQDIARNLLVPVDTVDDDGLEECHTLRKSGVGVRCRFPVTANLDTMTLRPCTVRGVDLIEEDQHAPHMPRSFSDDLHPRPVSAIGIAANPGLATPLVERQGIVAVARRPSRQ